MFPTLYTIPAPYMDADIEIYGEPDMGWYEFRVVYVNGKVMHDSKNLGAGAPGVAMRHALAWCQEVA